MGKKISNILESYQGDSLGRHLQGVEAKMQKVLYWVLMDNQRKSRSRLGVADHYYL